MILSIRGTSGAGKSTIVREIMRAFPGTFNRIMVEKRKRPIALLANSGVRSLFLVGHYDIPCGGADTISGTDRIYQMVREASEAGHDVIFEGRIIGVEVTRTVELAKAHRVVALHIDIPLQECIDSINIRRRAKNPDAEDVNPKNTTGIYKSIPRVMKRLEAGGVEVFRGDRAEVTAKIKELLAL